jgi:hypothetical protein
VDDDYDVAVQNLRSDSTMTFKDAVERIRQCEQELHCSSREATSKARRTTGGMEMLQQPIHLETAKPSRFLPSLIGS